MDVSNKWVFTSNSWICGSTPSGWVSSPQAERHRADPARRVARVIKRALAAAALVAAAALTGCSNNAGASLVFAADPSMSASLAMSNVAVQEPFSFGSIDLCVTAPARATIVGVSLSHVIGDVRVDAFAVRPNPFFAGEPMLGGQRITLVEYASGFQPNGPQVISGTCPRDLIAPTDAEARAVFELGVQVQLVSGETGGGTALDVRYQIDDGPERGVTVPFGIWLCTSTCPPDIGASARPSN